MRITAVVLGALLGCFMLFNSMYQLLTDTFFAWGVIPRPWIDIVVSFGINPYTLSPVFLVWGTAWVYFAHLLWHKQRRAYTIGLVASVFTLWYFPFGTIISVAVIGLLRSNRKPSGLLR
jgi:hypothetical protein